MSVSPHTVLVATRDSYDSEDGPPSARTIAETIDVDVGSVRPVLRSLCRVQLLAETATGYRPTVTGRELLERGIHLDDVAAVDIVDEG